MKTKLLLMACSAGVFFSCSPARQIGQSARQNVLNAAPLQTAHIGISVYDASSGKYLYNYQGDKYFVPASNTKLPTCYAAMKYLGDSLVSARIATDEEGRLRVYPSSDPTFLNPEFTYQPLFERMKSYKTILWYDASWKETRWGSGWSWNDYDAAYMAERSPLPIYGNVASFYFSNDTLKTIPATLAIDAASSIGYNKVTHTVTSKKFTIERGLDDGKFYLKPSTNNFVRASIPLRMDGLSSLLADTLQSEVAPFEVAQGHSYSPPKQTIHSQPADSLLKPMMHRSDNFFAEQSLLMVSNEVLGVMDDAKIIDTLLKTDFKDLPHKPKWVDGSGLSRYNLFTPQDFVVILNKMKTDFGMDRIKAILPTGNEGTLAGRFAADSNFIYAKTGTLSGVVSLSGFLYTKKNKLLIFSVLVNNHQAPAGDVRRAVEKFVGGLRERY